MNTILAVGKVVGGSVHLHVTPPALLAVTEADVVQTLDSLFGPVEECAPDGTLWGMIEAAQEPPTREERQDEAAYLCDTAAFYDRCKRQAVDLEEDIIDRLFWSKGEW